MLHQLTTRRIETLEVSPINMVGWSETEITGMLVRFERSRIPIMVWGSHVVKGSQRVHATKLMGGHSVRVLDLRTCCSLDVYGRFEVLRYMAGIERVSLYKVIGKVRDEEHFEECVVNLNKTSATAAAQFLNNRLKERGTYEPV